MPLPTYTYTKHSLTRIVAFLCYAICHASRFIGRPPTARLLHHGKQHTTPALSCKGTKQMADHTDLFTMHYIQIAKTWASHSHRRCPRFLVPEGSWSCTACSSGYAGFLKLAITMKPPTYWQRLEQTFLFSRIKYICKTDTQKQTDPNLWEMDVWRRYLMYALHKKTHRYKLQHPGTLPRAIKDVTPEREVKLWGSRNTPAGPVYPELPGATASRCWPGQ